MGYGDPGEPTQKLLRTLWNPQSSTEKSTVLARMLDKREIGTKLNWGSAIEFD